MLDDTVRVRVVPRDPYVVDVVLLREVIARLDPRRTIVGDELRKRTPTAQDVLKEPLTDSLRGFGGERASFGPQSSRAAGVHEVLVMPRHYH